MFTFIITSLNFVALNLCFIFRDWKLRSTRAVWTVWFRCGRKRGQWHFTKEPFRDWAEYV